ncbi:MAG: DNA-binding protein [Clostridia bacterium]|nr:DNA-binding protein [Clostridia bacterium]
MKDLNYLQLFDAYAPLLTESQREICELYYMCDLSLSEIAQEKGITKQAVSDTLKKSRELLDYYEEKLHHSAQAIDYSLKISLMMTEVVSALERFRMLHPQFTEEIREIANMVSVGEVTQLDRED